MKKTSNRHTRLKACPREGGERVSRKSQTGQRCFKAFDLTKVDTPKFNFSGKDDIRFGLKEAFNEF